MIATLQMYSLPELQDATERFWQAIADRAGLQAALSWPADYVAPWEREELLFSQTCGYPLTHDFVGRLKLVATPHYAAEGCVGPHYCSMIFARETRPLPRFHGQIAAFNSRDSMSGMLALKLTFAPFAESGRFFARALETGGHLASLAALQRGEADVAAIDCVTVALLRRYHPQALDGLVEVARSPQVPGLPYVTKAVHVPLLRKALAEVFADAALTDVRQALLLDGFSVLDESDYAVIPRLEAKMEAQGGLHLW